MVTNMDRTWFESSLIRFPRGIWLGFQKSMGLLVGGNHTSSSEKIMMDSKPVKFKILRGPLARRVLFRLFVIAMALSVVPLVQILSGPYFKMFASVNPEDCAIFLAKSANYTTGRFMFNCRFLNPIWASFEPSHCLGDVNFTASVVKELMSKQLLNYGAKALCIGEGSALTAIALQNLGFSNAHAIGDNRSLLFKRKQLVYEIDYEEKSFDFVFSKDLDKVSVPALLVLEIERILIPGGIGALVVGSDRLHMIPNSLIRSATSISSVLKSSSVVHVNHLNNLTLVVFKKKTEKSGYFREHPLPDDCSSTIRNKPFMDQMEPLLNEKPNMFEKKLSYLPKYVDLSSKKRLVYINIGAGEHLNSNATDWFPPMYPVKMENFNVYFVDHNTSVLLSYVKKPGITFVYHPGLAGIKANVSLSIDGDIEPYLGDAEFHFLAWFKETVRFAEFVILKMNGSSLELNFLLDLFESGAICFVDELFLNCPGQVRAEDEALVDCMDLFKDLRNKGVFVHQWWGNYNPINVW